MPEHASPHARESGPGAHPHGGGRRGFFDAHAEGWDERVATEAFLGRLRASFEALGIGGRETVVDLGCGTGNLTRLLAERRADGGRIVAVDFSRRMLEHARRKLAGGAGVHFVQAEAEALPLAAASADRVVCFSVWPHFADPARVAAELRRVLRPGGIVHVLHVDSRATINRIHGTAGGAVARDALPPAAEVAALLADHGLAATEVEDAADRYLVTARRQDGLA